MGLSRALNELVMYYRLHHGCKNPQKPNNPWNNWNSHTTYSIKRKSGLLNTVLIIEFE